MNGWIPSPPLKAPSCNRTEKLSPVCIGSIKDWLEWKSKQTVDNFIWCNFIITKKNYFFLRKINLFTWPLTNVDCHCYHVYQIDILELLRLPKISQIFFLNYNFKKKIVKMQLPKIEFCINVHYRSRHGNGKHNIQRMGQWK